MHLSSTVDVEFFLDGSFTFTLTPEHITMHGNGGPMDLDSGEACGLQAQLLVRQGQTKQFAFVFECG